MVLRVFSTSDVAGGGGDAYVSGAFHYDPINGSDSNNGIPSGETGSGATLNGTAGTGARQTEAQLRSDLSSGRYRPGDLVYIHLPGYTFTSAFVIRSNSTVEDVSNKLVIRSLPGERAVIDMGSISGQGSGANPIANLDANVVWQTFTGRCSGALFGSGGLTGEGSGTAHGSQWLDIIGDQVGRVSGGDNGGFWKVQGNSENFLIAGCQVLDWLDPTGATTNFALLYYINVLQGAIEYNDLHYAPTDTGGPTVHDKRAEGRTTLGDILIANNMLRRTGGLGRAETCRFAGTAYTLLRDNIHFGASPGWGDSGATDPACSNNEFRHETFHSASAGFTTVGSDTGNGLNNTMRSCLLRGGFEHWSPGTPPSVQNTGFTSNYNHGPGGSPYITYFGTGYTLANWQAIASGDTGQDANSVNETVNYAGTPDADDPTTFRLDAASAGKSAAHDGADIGADVDSCGPGNMPASYLWLNGTTKVAA